MYKARSNVVDAEVHAGIQGCRHCINNYCTGCTRNTLSHPLIVGVKAEIQHDITQANRTHSDSLNSVLSSPSQARHAVPNMQCHVFASVRFT